MSRLEIILTATTSGTLNESDKHLLAAHLNATLNQSAVVWVDKNTTFREIKDHVTVSSLADSDAR